MKQLELGIGMAAVGLCGLRFWARFPTETYRCPALVQMAFSFSKMPCSRDYSKLSRHSTPPDRSSPHELNMNQDPKSSSWLSSLKNRIWKSGSSEKKEKGKASTEVKVNTTTPAMVLGSERELLSVNKKQEEEILNLKHMIEKKNKEKEKVNASTEVKVNTTIPAMVVLRSEGELLSVNKKQEEEILRLNRMIEIQNKEVNLQVEKLMDLCLNLREEIKSLKSSFPDVTNSQLQELVEKQGSELKEAKQVKDLNPCLTPYNANKSRSRDSLLDESLSEDDRKVYPELDDFNSYDQKFSKSSDCYHHNTGKIDKIGITTKAS